MRRIAKHLKRFWPLFLLLTAIAAAILIYCNFYYIGLNRFPLHIGQGAAESPDGNYMLKVSICPTDFIPEDTDALSYIREQKIEAYLIGELWYDPVIDDAGIKQWDGKNSRVIYYDKFENAPVAFHWSDDHTLVINGVALNVPTDTYDFRRAVLNP